MQNREKQIEKNSLVLGWEFAYQNDRPCIVITEQIGNEIYILCSSFEIAGKIELQGYRKATDLAEEIFAEIERQLNDFNGSWADTVINTQYLIAELKKKYIGKDTNVTTNTEEK